MQPKEFQPEESLQQDGQSESMPEGRCNYAELWTALLVAFVQLDFIALDKDGSCYKQTVKLAYIMWLEAYPNNSNSIIDRLQNSDRVHLEGNCAQYDCIEADRIVGPEFLAPCFEETEEDQYSALRDFRIKHIQPKEGMRRLVLLRRVGMPHCTVEHEACAEAEAKFVHKE